MDLHGMEHAGGYDRWAAAVATAVAQARDSANAVLAGDFNATMEHVPMQELGDYEDAATSVGRGAEETWPSNRRCSSPPPSTTS